MSHVKMFLSYNSVLQYVQRRIAATDKLRKMVFKLDTGVNTEKL